MNHCGRAKNWVKPIMFAAVSFASNFLLGALNRVLWWRPMKTFEWTDYRSGRLDERGLDNPHEMPSQWTIFLIWMFNGLFEHLFMFIVHREMLRLGAVALCVFLGKQFDCIGIRNKLEYVYNNTHAFFLFWFSLCSVHCWPAELLLFCDDNAICGWH